jgi:hypothetical protein
LALPSSPGSFLDEQFFALAPSAVDLLIKRFYTVLMSLFLSWKENSGKDEDNERFFFAVRLAANASLLSQWILSS